MKIQYQRWFTFKQPTIVVVSAELKAVHKTVEYMRINPIKHDSKNDIKNPMSDQLWNSVKHRLRSPVVHDINIKGVIINNAL